LDPRDYGIDYDEDDDEEVYGMQVLGSAFKIKKHLHQKQ